jgi:spermidine synthase
MPTQKLLAHLPLLLHPAPRTACVIGLGSGVTVGAALTHPIDAVDAVEISPEVVAASALFRPFNGDALADPRLRLMVDDGRHHLLRTGRRYDVIISEPSNPWMAGVSPLFTREFYRIGASRLAPGGVFCQWMHLYNLERDDVRTLVGSFTDAFAEVALFLVNEGDALLIGSAARPVPTGPALRQRMARPAVAADLAGIDVRSPFAVASLFVVETPALRDWTVGADRHTDDRPVLEFRAPRALHRDTARGNRQALLEVASRAGPVEPYATITAAGDGTERLDRARLLERAHSFDWAFEAYADALARDPHLAAAGEGLVRAGLRAGRAPEAEARLESLAAGPAPVEAHVALALLAFNQDRGQAALDHLRRALERDPRQLRALGLATEVQQAAGNLEAAEGLAREALAAAPEDPEAAARLASVELAQGHVREARTRAEAVLSRDPRNARALEVAAVAHAQLSDRAAARRAFEALLAAAPDDWEALTNFGVFEMEGGDARAAARLFAPSVALNPGNRRGWEGLREAAGRLDDRALLRRAEAGLGGAGIR